MDNTNSARQTANALNAQQSSPAPLPTVDLLPLVNSMKPSSSFEMKVAAFSAATAKPAAPLNLPTLTGKPKAVPSSDEVKFTTSSLLIGEDSIGFDEHTLVIAPNVQEAPIETPKSVVLPAKSEVSENVFARSVVVPQASTEKTDTPTVPTAQQDRTQVQQQVQKKFDSISTILQDISGGAGSARRTERTVSEKAPVFSTRTDNNRKTSLNESTQAADNGDSDEGFMGLLSEFFGGMAGIAGFVFSDAQPSTGTGRR